MNRNLYFETTNLLFTRAQALVWVANGLSMLELFEKSSGKLLSEIIDICDEHKTVLVNFKGIIRLDDHCLDDVYNSLNKNRKQLIILNGEHLHEELIKLKKDKQVNISHDSANKIIIIGNSKNVSFPGLMAERAEAVSRYISTVLKSTFTKFEDFQRLCSTPFLANGEFDSKRIIESPKDFMWFSFYLSDKLSQLIETERLIDVVLVSASLRGSVFTSILGILNDLKYINIDHIGPIHKVYNTSAFDSEYVSYNYVYVGDFVFGGTEIKLTKVYVSLGGGKLNHALVLGSLFESDVFKEFKLYELNTLRAISPEANFKLFD